MGAYGSYERRNGTPGAVGDLHDLAVASGRRSLQLLRAIEDTIAVLANVADDARQIAQRNSEMAKRIWALRPGTLALDADDKLEDLFCQVQETARKLHSHYEARRESAVADVKLNPDDCVVDAFDDVISATCEVFKSCEELRFALREFDADSSPSSAPMSDIAGILAALKS